jgi:hypothetical protein
MKQREPELKAALPTLLPSLKRLLVSSSFPKYRILCPQRNQSTASATWHQKDFVTHLPVLLSGEKEISMSNSRLHTSSFNKLQA